jgi:hypothetical protein
MTFAGFCAIVIVLRQTTGKELSGFHLVFDPALSGIWQIPIGCYGRRRLDGAVKFADSEAAAAVQTLRRGGHEADNAVCRIEERGAARHADLAPGSPSVGGERSA